MENYVVGIDTSGGVCSVAIVSDSKLISEFSVNHKKTHSAMLVPMLDKMLKVSEISLSEVSLFAVANGPGSFTGLRIGAATAKGLAFATKKPIIGVSTLAGLAYNLRDKKALICPIMDARRNEVYTAAYDFSDKTETMGSEIVTPKACSINLLVEKLSEFKREVIFLGDGVLVYKDFIEENAEFDFSFASENLLLQRASSIALLGRDLAKKGLSGPSDSLKLNYLRKPQAERERELKGLKNA